ncbi:MAG: type VI secretion system protein TssA [Pyrinomonadaceae bacterium]
MSSAVETLSPAPSDEVVDVESLLAPIGGENPAGVDMRYMGLHDDISRARSAGDNLEQGDWKHEVKVADWGKVETLATDALATKTKDMLVCAWLGEALVKLYGFEGVRDALKIMRGLHERFWEQLYPEIDEGDMDARANAVASMSKQMAEAVKEVPLTKIIAGVAYSYIQWEDSQRFSIPENFEALDYDEKKRAEGLKQTAAEEGKITSEEWNKAKSAGSRAFYEAMFTVLNESWDESLALDRVMNEKFGDNPPGLGALQKSLENIRSVVEKIVKEKRVLEPDAVSASETGGADGEVTDESGAIVYTAASGGAAGPIRTRQDAINRLGEVADFFRKTEPHSPVSYLVQRAIKWGQMPLETWLASVIKDNNVLEDLRETLGINADDNGQ